MNSKAIRPALEVRSIEALDAEITTLSARMTAHEHELLVLVREFDERGGWLKWGSASCADWLHWRCDLSMSAAREKVRVAHALHPLPQISEAFERGALSYSKVRALTRVATPASEESLLFFALNVSAALVEQHCQQLRNVHQDSRRSANSAHERRSLSAFRRSQTNAMTLTVEIPLEDGELVLNALDKLIIEKEPGADASPSYRVRQVDALIDLCKRVLSDESLRGGIGNESGAASAIPSSTASADQYQVVVHVDQSALSKQPAPDARSDLPVETVRRLSCDGTLVPIESDANGSILNIGRKRRTVPTAMKRAIWARDRHCRSPGCTHTRFVDAHHIKHWAHGGETSLENLMLLCSHHHRLVHEGGFQIITDRHGEWCFRRPDGRSVPNCGYRRRDREDEYGENHGEDPSVDPSAEGSDMIREKAPWSCLASSGRGLYSPNEASRWR